IELEDAQAEEGEDKCEDVFRLLRDAHCLAEVPERLGELAERPERQGKRVPHERALDSGLAESLLRQALRDQRDRCLAVAGRLAALAPNQVSPAKIAIGYNLESDVLQRRADRQSPKASLNRRGGVAGRHEQELDHLVVQGAAQPAPVADGFSE